MFFIDTDIVLRNIPKNGSKPKLVVPKTFEDKVRRLCHDLPVLGHQGVSKTYLRVKEKFYWYSMNQTTKDFVQTCDICSNKCSNIFTDQGILKADSSTGKQMVYKTSSCKVKDYLTDL